MLRFGPSVFGRPPLRPFARYDGPSARSTALPPLKQTARPASETLRTAATEIELELGETIGLTLQQNALGSLPVTTAENHRRTRRLWQKVTSLGGPSL